jgi:hypothetical protein
MRGILFIFICFFNCIAHAQADTSFTRILASTDEITVADSLEVQTANWKSIRMDSTDVKKYFSPLLGSITNNRLKNRSYFLLGKISSEPLFNVFLVLEEKKRSDTTETRVLYAVTTKKDGKFISSLELAVTGPKKKTNYDTHSCIYPGLVIRKQSSLNVNDETLTSSEIYKVLNSGRFVLSPAN